MCFRSGQRQQRNPKIWLFFGSFLPRTNFLPSLSPCPASPLIHGLLGCVAVLKRWRRMTDDLSEWVIQSEPRGRAGEGEMEWFAGDMRAESGRLNLEGAIIKNLFASFYPPLPSWQSRLPLTIKDLITICKNKRMGWGKWKYVRADTLNGRWFCRGTSVRRLWLCLSAVHSHPTANYFYCRRSCADQYRRIDTNDIRRVQYQIIIITDSTLLGRLIQMCVIEQATCS